MAPRKLKRNKRASSRHYYRHPHQDTQSSKNNNNSPMPLNADGLIKSIDMSLIGNSSSSSSGSRDGESLPFYDMNSNQSPTGNEVENRDTDEESDFPPRKSLRKGKSKSKSRSKRNYKRAAEETPQKKLDRVSQEGQENNNKNQIDFEIVNLPHSSRVCVDGKCAIVRPSRRSSRKGKSQKKARSKSKSKRSYKKVSRSQNRNNRSKRK